VPRAMPRSFSASCGSDCVLGRPYLLAGICKIVPPMGAALPASLVRCPSYQVIAQLVSPWPPLTASVALQAIKHNLANPADNKPYRFTTRQQDVTDTVWSSFENILLFSEGSK